MKSSDAILLGGAALAAYLLLRNSGYIAGQVAQVPTGGLTWGATGLNFNANIPGTEVQSAISSLFGRYGKKPLGIVTRDFQTRPYMNSNYFRRRMGHYGNEFL